jgi:hypothetical protein
VVLFPPLAGSPKFQIHVIAFNDASLKFTAVPRHAVVEEGLKIAFGELIIVTQVLSKPVFPAESVSITVKLPVPEGPQRTVTQVSPIPVAVVLPPIVPPATVHANVCVADTLAQYVA